MPKILFKARARDVQVGELVWIRHYKLPWRVHKKTDTWVRLVHTRTGNYLAISLSYPILIENTEQAKTLGLA